MSLKEQLDAELAKYIPAKTGTKRKDDVYGLVTTY